MRTIAPLLTVLIVGATCVADTNDMTWEEYSRRYASISIGDVDFRSVAFTNVLAEINARLATSTLKVRLDFSPPTYFIPADRPDLAEPCDRLIQEWKRNVETMATSPKDVEDAPLLTWRQNDVKVVPFLLSIRHLLGLRFLFDTQQPPFVLRSQPGPVECRAYQFTSSLTDKLNLDPNVPLTLDNFRLDDHWSTNEMVWIQRDRVLLRIGTPGSFEVCDKILDLLGGATRLPMKELRTTTPRTVP